MTSPVILSVDSVVKRFGAVTAVDVCRSKWSGAKSWRVAVDEDAAFFAAHPAVEQLEQRDGEIRLRTRADASLSDLLSAAASRLTILAVHSERAKLHDIYVQTVAGGTAIGEETR